MKTVKIALAVVLMASLSGCFGIGEDRPQPIRTEYKVVMPEEKYFECNRVALPNPDTLSNTQIAELINDLVSANRVCANNMEGIHRYLEAAQQVLEERQD